MFLWQSSLCPTHSSEKHESFRNNGNWRQTCYTCSAQVDLLKVTLVILRKIVGIRWPGNETQCYWSVGWACQHWITWRVSLFSLHCWKPALLLSEHGVSADLLSTSWLGRECLSALGGSVGLWWHRPGSTGSPMWPQCCQRPRWHTTTCRCQREPPGVCDVSIV